jgi:murein DD-endopeptidase MepM/ murein hydrolase activator NlpD
VSEDKRVLMPVRLTLSLLIFTVLLSAAWPAVAAPPVQTSEVYVVQPGDTLLSIALRFGVTAADIAAANSLSNPNLIFVGQRLIIPGAAPMVEPAIVTDQDQGTETPPAAPQVYAVQPGDTLFLIATRFGLTVTELALVNGIRDPNYIYVGQQLVIPPPRSSSAGAKHPAPFAAVELSPDPALQGQTLVVRVRLSEPATLSGDFDGRPLFFTGDDSGGWAVVGIHALQEIGIYPLALRAKLSDGTTSATTVGIVVGAGPYGTENIQLAPGRENLLAPEVIQAEQARMVEVWSQVSPRPLWEGLFGLPIANSRITSVFGTRRSYNNGPVNSFHGGTDFGAGSGTPIYAPAAGRVVLAEGLTVRGNAVLVDHGLGGQTVQRGDLIGYVGDTGLVTGAHLHWEMRIGGIAVDPMQWTQRTIP